MARRRVNKPANQQPKRKKKTTQKKMNPAQHQQSVAAVGNADAEEYRQGLEELRAAVQRILEARAILTVPERPVNTARARGLMDGTVNVGHYDDQLEYHPEFMPERPARQMPPRADGRSRSVLQDREFLPLDVHPRESNVSLSSETVWVRLIQHLIPNVSAGLINHLLDNIDNYDNVENSATYNLFRLSLIQSLLTAFETEAQKAKDFLSEQSPWNLVNCFLNTSKPIMDFIMKALDWEYVKCRNIYVYVREQYTDFQFFGERNFFRLNAGYRDWDKLKAELPVYLKTFESTNISAIYLRIYGDQELETRLSLYRKFQELVWITRPVEPEELELPAPERPVDQSQFVREWLNMESTEFMVQRRNRTGTPVSFGDRYATPNGRYFI